MSIVIGNDGRLLAGSGGESDPPLPEGVRVVRITPELRLAAASRLVADQTGDPFQAGERFLESASKLGIDLTYLYGTVDTPGSSVRQACLAVIGAGRTAMFFVSGPIRKAKSWRSTAAVGSTTTADDAAERGALINEACRGVLSRGVRLAQSLLEPREKEALAALRLSGFMQLGDLAYLRRPLTSSPPGTSVSTPNGVQVRTVAQMEASGVSWGEIDDRLIEALDRSYVDTMDCPELCGMREPRDVLESHKAVGRFDPTLWWVAEDAEGPQACLLLSPCPEQETVELVYLGLAPAWRGRGLGATLLNRGLAELTRRAFPGSGTPRQIDAAGGVTCAVDTRNTPAMRLYRKAGFQRFGVRIPLVKSLA